MAQSTARKHEVTADTNGNGNGESKPAAVATWADTNLVIPVDDGVNGHFVVIKAPVMDSSEQSKLLHDFGFRWDVLRQLQSAAKSAKKAGKDVRAAMQERVNKLEPMAADRIGTLGDFRRGVAHELMKKLHESKGLATDDATLTLNLPKYLAKRQAEVDAEVERQLTAGYTPSRKGAGKAESKGAEISEDTY